MVVEDSDSGADRDDAAGYSDRRAGPQTQASRSNRTRRHDDATDTSGGEVKHASPQGSIPYGLSSSETERADHSARPPYLPRRGSTTGMEVERKRITHSYRVNPERQREVSQGRTHERHRSRASRPWLEAPHRRGRATPIRRAHPAHSRATLDPADTKEFTAWGLKQGFSKGELKEGVAAAQQQAGDCRTLWHLVQGLTAYAQKFAWADAQVDLSTRAGSLLDLVA